MYEKVTITCQQCRDKYTRPVKSKARREFCPKCVLKELNIQGPTHHAFKHGRYAYGRFNTDINGLHYRKQRALCKERDNYTCRLCHTILPSKKLDAHHIVKWKDSKSHALSNLITLCKACHYKYERQYEKTGRSLFFGDFFWLDNAEEVPF